MIPWDWNATPEERAAHFPSDDYLNIATRRLTRAVTIAAQPPADFRWLCQLKVAPYSYDGTCRLVVRLDAGASTSLQRIRRALLASGDLIMMRKQLLTLKKLAEREPTRSTWRTAWDG